MVLFVALIIYLAALTNAVQLQDQTQESVPNAPSGYAPQGAKCPPSALIRSASSGVGNEEQAYFNGRKLNADNALKSWLTKVGYREVEPSRYPSVGLSISGGGYRSMLEGAGIIQAFDSRDSTSKVAGLYQAFTYQSGLSGGGWLLSSIAGNNWATVSSLVSRLWASSLSGFILAPGGLLAAPFNTARILSDINSKSKAGFGLSLTDPWGRLISFQVLGGGGFLDIVAQTLSSITQLSSFKSYSVPYPILTAIQTRPGECLPKERSPQFEIHPFEFGSWDGGIGAFMQTTHLGTRMDNGVPLNGTCIQGYDDLGFVIGTSSNLFSLACAMTRNSANPDASADMSKALGTFLGGAAYDPDDLEYACYPNPFQNFPGSPRVSNLEKLHLVDGGLSNQNNPIWPFIQSSRSRVIDVLIVNDNSADTSFNWPNGSEIAGTYQQATYSQLTRMPKVPNVSTFISEGLNKRATFFGCNNPSVVTIIYLPNAQYNYGSNTSTFTFSYPALQMASMIGNGNAIATQNGDPEWPGCLACGIMQKTASRLPEHCAACLSKYCHSGISSSNNNYESVSTMSQGHPGKEYSGFGTPTFTPNFQPDLPSYYNNPARPGALPNYGRPGGPGSPGRPGGPGGPFKPPGPGRPNGPRPSDGPGRPGGSPNGGNPNHPGGPPNAGNPNHPGGPPIAGNPNHPGGPPSVGNPNHPGGAPNVGNPNHSGGPPNVGNPNHPGGAPNVGNPNHPNGSPNTVKPGNPSNIGGSSNSGLFGGLFGGSPGSGSSISPGGSPNSGNSGSSGLFGGLFGGSSSPASSVSPNHPNNNNGGLGPAKSGSGNPGGSFGNSGNHGGSPSGGLFGGAPSSGNGGIVGGLGSSGGHPNGGGLGPAKGHPGGGASGKHGGRRKR